MTTYDIERLPSGASILTATVNGRSRFLSSRVNPYDEGQKWAAGQNIAQCPIVILVGVSGPYRIDAIRSIMHPDGAVLAITDQSILLPPDAPWLTVADISKPEHLSIIQDWMMRHATTVICDRYRIVIDAVITGLNPSVWSGILDQLSEYIQFHGLRIKTQVLQGARNVHNGIANWNRYQQSRPFSALAKTGKGRHAVVIGAGPSLSDWIETLKHYTDRLFILAVDSAIGPLVKGGIRPDILITCDPSSQNRDHFEKLPSDWQAIPLVTTMTSSPDVWELFSGPCFTPNHPLSEWGIENHWWPTHGDLAIQSLNVGFLGISTAMMMEFDQTDLIGFDFVVTDCVYANHVAKQWRISDAQIEKTNGDGTKHTFATVDYIENGVSYRTTELLLSYVVFFRQYADRITTPFANLSQWGLALPGIPRLSPASVLARWNTVPQSLQWNPPDYAYAGYPNQLPQLSDALDQLCQMIRSTVDFSMVLPPVVAGDSDRITKCHQTLQTTISRIQSNASLNHWIDPLITAEILAIDDIRWSGHPPMIADIIRGRRLLVAIETAVADLQALIRQNFSGD